MMLLKMKMKMKKSNLKGTLDSLIDMAIVLEIYEPSDTSYDPIEDTQVISKLIKSLDELRRAETAYVYNINQNSKDAGNKSELIERFKKVQLNLLRLSIAHNIECDSIESSDNK